MLRELAGQARDGAARTGGDGPGGRSTPSRGQEAGDAEPGISSAVEVMPDEAIAALAALDLANADMPSAYVARRVAELRLVAPMVRLARSPGRDRDRMSGTGLVPVPLDGVAEAGIVSPPAVVPASDGAVGVPTAPAPARAVPPEPRTAARPVEARSRVAAMRVSPRPSPSHGADGTVDAARAAASRGLSTSSAPPVDVDRLPPAAAAALAALDRANADTPEAALARRIDEARLRASVMRSRRRSPDRERPETASGRVVSAAEAVAHASPSPAADLPSTGISTLPSPSTAPACPSQGTPPRSEVRAWPKAVQERLQGGPAIDAERGRTANLGSAVPPGIVVRADDLRQRGPGPLPRDALSALLALDLAMADTPAAYVARRIAEMRLRASIQRRTRPTLSVNDRQTPSPDEVAAAEPAPSRGIDRLPQAMFDDPMSPMPSTDDGPRAGRDGGEAGDTPAMSDVGGHRSWALDRPRSTVAPDPGIMLSGRDDAGSAAPQRASMTETDPVAPGSAVTGPGIADRASSDLARLYYALGEERRSGRRDGTGRRTATSSSRHTAIDGIGTHVTPAFEFDVERSDASPVLPASIGADAYPSSQAFALIAAPVPTGSTLSPAHRRTDTGEVGPPPARDPAARIRVSGPAHEAMAPSPSDRSVPMSVPGLPVDGMEIDVTDIDDMRDIEDVIAAINASAVPAKEPEAPAIDPPAPPRSPEPAGQTVREGDESEAPVRSIRLEVVEDVDVFAGIDLDGIDDAFDLVDDQDATRLLEPEPEHSSPSLLSTVRRVWRWGWDWMNGGPSETQDAGAIEPTHPASPPASTSTGTAPASRPSPVREAEVPRAKQAEPSPAFEVRAIASPRPAPSSGDPESDRPATLTTSPRPEPPLSKPTSGPWVPERIATGKRPLLGLLAFHLMTNGENLRFTRRIESLIELLGPDGGRFATYVRDRIRNARGSDAEIAARAGIRLAGLSSWADGLKGPVTRRFDAELIQAEVCRVGGPTAKLAPVDPVLPSDGRDGVGGGVGVRPRNRHSTGPER